MRHGHNDVPDYMLAPSRGDYTGVGDIHFLLQHRRGALRRAAGIQGRVRAGKCALPVTARPGMTHCYCMLPYFKEAKEDFAMIVEQLKK